MIDSLVANGYTLARESFLRDFRQRLDDYYVQRDTEFIEYTTGYILKTMLAQYGFPQVPGEHIKEALRALYAVSQSHWLRESDAIATLEALRTSGYRLGIVSNAADATDVDTLLERNGLCGYFEQVLVSASVGYRKPHPKIFELAIDYFQSEPGDMAMVGDTLGADILGANQAGMHSIWLTRRADTPANHDHLDTIRPDEIIQKLSDLPPLLAHW